MHDEVASEQKLADIKGVFTAVATPLTADYEPDLELFVDHCRWLLANGCGLAPLGTTGEANSLSVDQRLRMIEALQASDLTLSRMLIGTGSCALADAIALTSRAVAAGAGGVLLLPPFYYKNASEEGLFKFFSDVIDKVANRDLRVYLYHFPAMSHIPIFLSLILRLRKSYGDIIEGLKDSSGDWAYTARALEEIPGFRAFSGSEEFLLRNLRAGGPGCISATTNVTCGLAHDVARQWRTEAADTLQSRLNETRFLFQNHPLQAAVKESLARSTNRPSWRNILPPNIPMQAAAGAALYAQIETYLRVDKRP